MRGESLRMNAQRIEKDFEVIVTTLVEVTETLRVSAVNAAQAHKKAIGAVKVTSGGVIQTTEARELK